MGERPTLCSERKTKIGALRKGWGTLIVVGDRRTKKSETWGTRLQSEYVFFGGERVARRDGVNGSGGVFYYFSDHLKTASVITDAAGNIRSESDYYPWGGELQFLANDSNHYKFTGKERDAETGLDYFGARYYSSGLGRWISADWSVTPVPVPYADFNDPQSLNLYAYAQNAPSVRFDVDGHRDDRSGTDLDITMQQHVASVVGRLNKLLATPIAPPGGSESHSGEKTDIAIGVVKEVTGQLSGITHVVPAVTQVAGFFGLPDPLAANNATQDKTMTFTAFTLFFMPIWGEEAAAGKGERTLSRFVQHHIATDKHSVFTPLFENLFAKYGMNLQDPANRMLISSLLHNSSHPPEYHRWVLRSLERATAGRKGETGAAALRRALERVARQIAEDPARLRWPR